jgi:hypothetical protein
MRLTVPALRRAAGCLFGLLAALATESSSAGGEFPGPEEVLAQEFGLIRRGKSEVWITPREASLRRQLGQLPAMVDRARSDRDWIVETHKNNFLLWPQRKAREGALKKSLGQLSPSDPQRRPLEEEMKALDRTAVSPEKLAGAPWVQPRLVDLSSRFNAILLSVFAARRDAELLGAEYQSLVQNRDVSRALEQLGGGHRLGPLRDYAPDLRRLDEFEQFVFNQAMPLYLQSGHVRIGAILNERMPVTFTWRESSEATVITAGIAQAAGIVPEPNAPQMTISCGPGRRVRANRVVLATLRFGKHVLRDVEAWLLPPEAEDCGCGISSSAFSGFQAAAEPVHLFFRIEPAR